MNLLCPNCQKMLTVPEEYAGQLMKCPMCNGTFTVPALPTSAAAPSPVPAGPPGPTAAAPDVYGLRHEPEPTPPPSFRPDGVTGPDLKSPAPPPPSSTATTKVPPPSPPPAPSTSAAPPEGYTRAPTVWLSPKVLRWVPAVALLLVFILQLPVFPWVGLYPGGVPGMTQSAWGAAFGSCNPDPDLAPVLPSMQKTEKPEDNAIPGASWLTIFYLLLFFPTLAVTAAVLVFDLSLIPVKLPPQVDKLLPWRWGIVAAVNLLLLFFLALQLIFGFSLDSHYAAWVDRKVQAKEAKKTDEVKLAEVERGKMLEDLTHTIWLRLAVVLHILAVICAVLMYLLLQRSESRPLPRMELLW
jgi:hypothetical protein